MVYGLNALQDKGYLDLICLGMDEIEVKWEAESVCPKQIMLRLLGVCINLWVQMILVG